MPRKERQTNVRTKRSCSLARLRAAAAQITWLRQHEARAETPCNGCGRGAPWLDQGGEAAQQLGATGAVPSNGHRRGSLQRIRRPGQHNSDGAGARDHRRSNPGTRPGAIS